MSRLDRPSRSADQGGVIAVIVAICMAGLLVIAGLVINLGLARTDRVTNKSFTDAAAAAGIRATDIGDGLPHPFPGICTAVAYLKVNDPAVAVMTSSWRTGAGAAIATDPCVAGSALANSACVANDPTTWGWFTGVAGRNTVDIKSGYNTQTDDALFGSAGSTDNSANGGCDQLAVFIHETEQPGLGGGANGKADIVTPTRSVARAVPSTLSAYSVALLILERTDCPAITVNSQNTKVEVQGFGAQPGLIASDSLGNGPNCGGNKTQVLTGKFSKNILADPAESGGLPGIVTVAALSGLPGAVPANATDGQPNVCAMTTTGTCNAPTGRAVIGRGPVDTRYLAGVKTAMTNAASATSGYNMTKPQAILQGYTVLGGPGNACKNMTTPLAGATDTSIYFDCASGVSFKDFTMPNATNVVFSGSASVNATQTLSMPSATRVYVKGTAGGNGFDAQGILKLNIGGSSDCTARALTAPPRAQLVVGNGSFTGGAQSEFHMCSTTLLMSEGWQSTCALPTSPVTPGAPPADNLCNGFVGLGGGGAMDWTAPNLVGPSPSVTDYNNLEDLALWTEASALSTIGGGGALNVSGVFFLPNATVNIGGNGNQTIGSNAQFVARKLSANGGGTLLMRPNPNDVIDLPPPASYNLVR